MRMAPRTLAAVVVVAMGVALAGPAWAREPGASAYVKGSLRKLGRGIANVGTAVFEIPRTTDEFWQREGIVGATGVGFVTGIWRMSVRIVAGIYEVGTFFIEVPDGFEPIVKPEFIFARGNWLH